MKLFISLLFFTATSLVVISCGGNESDSVRDAARQSIEPEPVQAPVQSSAANPGDLVPIGSVRHYICPNNCEGSGGSSAGNCPVCGTEYVHNAAYHAQGAPGAGQTPNVPAPAATPAQNAAGVYHYICNNGCEGGGGSAGACAVCGAQLVHNQAYHQ
jgi:hypothetical protein